MDETKTKRPAFKVCQQAVLNGKTVLLEVGQLWENTGKSNTLFYTLRLSAVKLLVFPNNKKEEGQEAPQENKDSGNRAAQ